MSASEASAGQRIAESAQNRSKWNNMEVVERHCVLSDFPIEIDQHQRLLKPGHIIEETHENDNTSFGIFVLRLVSDMPISGLPVSSDTKMSPAKSLHYNCLCSF